MRRRVPTYGMASQGARRFVYLLAVYTVVQIAGEDLLAFAALSGGGTALPVTAPPVSPDTLVTLAWLFGSLGLACIVASVALVAR